MKNAAGSVAYTLFGTTACHLCELAEDMLETISQAEPGVIVEKVDISASDELFERYGVRIPVLRDPLGRELGWPFTAAQLREFIAGCPAQ